MSLSRNINIIIIPPPNATLNCDGGMLSVAAEAVVLFVGYVWWLNENAGPAAAAQNIFYSTYSLLSLSI